MRVKSKMTKAVDWIIAFFALFAIMLCLFPFLNVAATSFSDRLAIANNKVFLLPVNFTLEFYTYVLNDVTMVRALGFTVLITVVSTITSMFMTVICAYPLTQDNMVGKKIFNTIAIFTMYFGAGMIPNYLNIKRLGLLDNFWVLILPGCLSVYNMIILKSFFRSIPASLQESAELDGASHWVVLFRVFLPLSMSSLATLSLFYAVGRWNGFQDALMYISNPKMYPIQYKLYQIVNNLSAIDTNLEGSSSIAQLPQEGMRAASIMFATVPILLVYPWLQKYFVTGVTVGAVKG